MNTIQKEFQNLQHKQQFLTIMLFSFVTIIVWISISLITSQKSTTISSELQRLALPLNPNINIDVITSLESQQAYDPSQLSNFPIYTLLKEGQTPQTSFPASSASESGSLLQGLTTIPSPSPEPVASESADITASPSPTATTSAEAQN